MRLRLSLFSFLFLVIPAVLPAQQPQKSDAQALALATQSIAALAHGISVRDVSLSGDATWVVGPDREDTKVTLIASGRTESRVDIQLPTGSRVEVRSGLSGAPEGKWTNPSGAHGLFTAHNCWTDSSWFFPVLSSLSGFADRNYIFSYIGKEQWNGLSVYHLHIYRTSKISGDLAQLSAMDFYLDPGSLLPLGLSFKTHPDGDMRTDISAQVLFADYRMVNGVQVPFRIQRHIGGGVLDVTLTDASFNSAVPDTTFSIR